MQWIALLDLLYSGIKALHLVSNGLDDKVVTCGVDVKAHATSPRSVNTSIMESRLMTHGIQIQHIWL